MIQQTIDGVRWQLQPDFAPLLDEVLKSTGAIVKESPVKTVARHQVRGREFYLKRYRHHRVAGRPLKFFFKASQAAEEWRLAAELEQRSIPIVRHVALGERWSSSGLQESILITEGFPGRELSELPEVPATAVQAFVEQMHARGVLQRDLHPANLLARLEPLELRLVDLHGTVVKPALSVQEREENLAILRGYFPITVSPEVLKQSIQLHRRHWQARSRRCLRHNRDFAPMRLGKLRWYTRQPMSAQVEAILKRPDDFLSSAQPLKKGRSATVSLGQGVVLKRFNFRRLTRLVKDLFRRSPALESFQKAYHLELVGIPTARGLAAAEERWAGFLVRSYFLMEAIPGAVSLQDKARGQALSEDTLAAVGRLVGLLHRAGFSHRDLKASNILFDQQGQARIIDLDGLKFYRDLPHARAEADLQRLHRSLRELGEFSETQWTNIVAAYSGEQKAR